MLYKVRDVIAYPLKLLSERSLEIGQLPADWKYSTKAAIYKKGPKSDVGNYRPVSLTSVICKVLESIIRDHSMTHLLKNELLSSQQHGFIKGRSTALQLLNMLDNWTEALEIGGQIDTIYSKNDHWCTNRHMSTQSPLNTQSPHLRPPNTLSHIECTYQVKTSVYID